MIAQQQGMGNGTVTPANPAAAAVRPAQPVVQHPASPQMQPPPMVPQAQPAAPGAQVSNMMMRAQPGNYAASVQPTAQPQQRMWQPPQQWGGQQDGWPPPRQQQQWGGGQGYGQQQQPQQAPQRSMLQQALAGGSNTQQTQNFLHALQQSGAGSNNSYMSSGAQPQQQAQQMIGAPVQDNGGYGQTSYAGGFNQGMGGVSYNSGLGASAANAGTGGGTTGNIQQDNGQTPQWAGQVQFGAGQYNATNPSVNVPGLGGPQGQVQQVQGQRLSAPQNPAAMAMSDERAKTEIAPAEDKTRAFLNTLNAWEYEYKDPKHGVGTFYSPMAQELEKTPVGKSAVVETPEGKFVDYARLSGIQLAASADFHKRLLALEGKK